LDNTIQVFINQYMDVFTVTSVVVVPPVIGLYIEAWLWS